MKGGDNVKISSKTSGVSLHFKKHKANDSSINNLQRHNERQPGDKYKRMNKKIDPNRTHENIIIKKAEKTFYMDAKNKIKEHRKNGLKGVRKDAVRLVEGTVQLSGQVLDRDESEQERVLMESYEWLKERFGEENIISAVIHKDETHMHLHFDFVPIKDGELNAKKIIDATKLHEYQETFLEYLQEKEKSMNFIRIKDEHNGLPQDVYEKLQEEREEMLNEVEEERQGMLEDISKQQQELDRRKMELDMRESSLEAHTAIFKAKVEEFDLKAENERNRASEREQNLEIKQEKLNKMTKELDVQRKSFDKHVHFAIQDIKTMMSKLYDMTLNQIQSMQKIEENIVTDLDRNNDFNTFTEDIEALTQWQNEQLEDDLEL